MDLKSIIRIIKRWAWLLILGVVIAGGYGYYSSNQQTPIYQARTRFVILRAVTTGFDYFAFMDYQQLVQTYTQLLSTDALLEQASEELGYSAFGVSANASQIGETQFMSLTVNHHDPVKAAEIANVLVAVLIEQNEQLQNVRYETTERNMQARADHALQQIDLLQTQINEISSISVKEQLEQVESEIDALQAQIIEYQSQINTLQSEIDGFDEEFATEEQIAQNEAAKARLAETRVNLNQVEPVLGLYQQIYTNLIVLGRTPDSEASTSVELSQLRTNLNLYQQIYVSSINSLESLNLTRAQNAPNVVQIEPARVPNRPISPRPMQSATMYGSIGLLAMAGIAFLVEYFDDTIKTPDEVKNVLGLPVIGLIADMNDSLVKHKEVNKGVFVANQPRSPISEAFRSMRTSLEFYSVDKTLQMLIVTSSGAEEGKTTISTNLAVILAKGNKKVLLLDADLRRPNVHNHMGISNRIGLSHLIRSRLSIEEVIQVSPDVPNLSVITSGSLPPNPAELLASEKMKNILLELKTMYDVIVIDTPPAIVTDAQILATKADGVIYVLRPGKTRAVAAKTPLEEFERIGANLIGVVMNRIPRNREYYYGGFDYYAPSAQKNGKYFRPEEG